MSLAENPFTDLPIATLQAMQTQWLQVLSDIAGGGKSYTFPGRSFSRADMPEVRKNLMYLKTALRLALGQGFQTAQVRIDTQNPFSG